MEIALDDAPRERSPMEAAAALARLATDLGHAGFGEGVGNVYDERHNAIGRWRVGKGHADAGESEFSR